MPNPFHHRLLSCFLFVLPAIPASAAQRDKEAMFSIYAGLAGGFVLLFTAVFLFCFLMFMLQNMKHGHWTQKQIVKKSLRLGFILSASVLLLVYAVMSL
jgi:hypothetical protein